MAGILEPPELQNVLDRWPPTHHPEGLLTHFRIGTPSPFYADVTP